MPLSIEKLSFLKDIDGCKDVLYDLMVRRDYVSYGAKFGLDGVRRFNCAVRFDVGIP